MTRSRELSVASMHLIVDSHLDLAWNALSWSRDLTTPVAEVNAHETGMTDHRARAKATTTFPEMRRGSVAVCFATVLARCRPGVRPSEGHQRISLDFNCRATTYAAGRAQLAYYRQMERQGELRQISSAGELQAHWEEWERAGGALPPLGYVLSMEGADPIVTPGDAAEWWDEGLRCVSLVHYGRNHLAGGTGDDSSLTSEGKELLGEMEQLGMILDVTHLSDPSFFASLENFAGPIVATHNNCRHLVPGVRQLSDAQVRAIVQRHGVIGAALDAWMLHPGWVIGETNREVVALDAVADHIDHVCQLAGNAEHVAIGSDLDGGFGTEQVPTGLETIADLQRIGRILADRGYSAADVEAVMNGNWRRFLGAHLPA